MFRSVNNNMDVKGCKHCCWNELINNSNQLLLGFFYTGTLERVNSKYFLLEPLFCSLSLSLSLSTFFYTLHSPYFISYSYY